jgi:hypothetical protein
VTAALPILLLLALALVLRWVLTEPRDTTRPPNSAQRLAAYGARVDRAHGRDSEAHLVRVARGIEAKAALLHCLRQRDTLRAPVPPHRALVPVSPVRVRFTGRRPRRHLRAVA